MKPNFKPGDKVVMNDHYHAPTKYQGKVWTVESEPWMVCGSWVVKLEGRASGYVCDGLSHVQDGGLVSHSPFTQRDS